MQERCYVLEVRLSQARVHTTCYRWR